MNIHPTAIIKPGARLADDVCVEEYAYIGAHVCLGSGCVVHHHATIDGNTVMGDNNIVHPYAYIGGLTQDLKYTSGNPGLKIGNNNVFREFCTMHVATKAENCTLIGNHNNFLAYSHVAHDCIVGDHVIMSAQAALGGHVVVDDFANIGWSAGVHQFCRVGKYAIIGACCKAAQDIPPFMLADGNPAHVRYINIVNLERHGFGSDRIAQVKKIFKLFYMSGLNRQQALERLKNSHVDDELRTTMLKFASASTRGFA